MYYYIMQLPRGTRVLGNNVIISPTQSNQSDTGFESEFMISAQKGTVIGVGDCVDRVSIGDNVIFLTMLDIIRDEGWYVVPESDIKVVII